MTDAGYERAEHPAGADSPDPAGVESPDVEPVPLAPPARLSESILWDVQQRYFARTGVGAFASGEVPFLMASGPLMARAVVRLLEAFVEDCLAGRFGPIDTEEPLYVLELGAGSGRLAYYCLEALAALAPSALRIVYVLTDQVEATLDFWLSHHKLRAFFEAGRADVAMYAAGPGGGLRLRSSGTELVAGGASNPLGVIANYLFDVIPQDLYAVIGDRLFEELVEVIGADADVDADSHDFFSRIFLTAHHRRAVPGRYGERVERVLTETADARTGADRRFLFPAAAIETIDDLAALSNGRMLLILGERQQYELIPACEVSDSVPGATPRLRTPGSSVAYRPDLFFGMGIHGGSMSLPVDLEILATAMSLSGGALVGPQTFPAAHTISALVAGDAGRATSLRDRFRSAVEAPSPDDLYFTIRTALRTEDITLREILSMLRVSGYDPYVFADCFDKLAPLVPADSAELNNEVVRVLEQIHALHFPFEDRGDLAGGLYTMMARAGRYAEALEHFAVWRAEHGPRPESCYAVAMCHLALKDPDAALGALDEATALDPSYMPAVQLRDAVLAQRAQGSGPIS